MLKVSMNLLRTALLLFIGLLIQGCSKPISEKAMAMPKARTVTIDEQMPQEVCLPRAIKELSKSLSAFPDTSIQIRFKSSSGGWYQSIGYRRDYKTLNYALDSETGADLYWNQVSESVIHSIAGAGGNMSDFGYPDITRDTPSTRAARERIGLTASTGGDGPNTGELGTGLKSEPPTPKP